MTNRNVKFLNTFYFTKMYVLRSVFENIKDCLTLEVLHTNLIHLSPCKIAFSNILLFLHYSICCSESEFKEFEPRLKSAKNGFSSAPA